MRRRLVAGNWKMNGTGAALAEVAALAAALADLGPERRPDILLCPPATLLHRMSAAGPFATGGQDCHPEAQGPHTGDVSAPMLREAGATAVILGHSERRADHAEGSALVAAKVRAAWGAGLRALVCIGETGAERDAGRAEAVVLEMLAASLPEGAAPDTTVVAYEPVWAIGTGRTPTGPDIAAMHGAIRAGLAARFGREAAAGFRLLYGGSVKAANAAAIFALPDVDGALVGGASLRAADFAPIVRAAAV